MLDILGFKQKLIDAIADNTVILPTLPEVALKVREIAEQDKTTAVDLANIIATDAAISARLLQVANSPLYRARSPIENIQMAVTRLGNKLVKSLVTTLAMKQIYQATSSSMEKRLRKVWEDSTQVAAVSKVLAQNLPQLENEQAMLAGLIHNIGVLPILMMADEIPECEDEKFLDSVLDALYSEIGTIILDHWGFPEVLSSVPNDHADTYRTALGEVDYADLVLVSRIQLGLDVIDDDNWSNISAFERVGLDTNVHIIDIEDTREEIEIVLQAIA